MVEGIFQKKSWVTVVIFLCGLFLIAMHVFAKIVDADLNILPGIIPGALLCVWGLILLLFNRNAFIRIQDNHVSARYHWHGKLECDISDIQFVFGELNGLSILLKNGKWYTIRGVANSFPLCLTLRRLIPFEAKDTPADIFEKLNTLKASRKKELVYVCIGIALMFIGIFITVYFTGGRDLHEFSTTDWTVMAIMGVVELVTIIELFFIAIQTGKKRLPTEHLKYNLTRTFIETQSLPSGNIKHIFTEPYYSGRMIVFDCPNDTKVHYIVQRFDVNYNLITVYTSESDPEPNYPNEEALLKDTEHLIDITEKFTHPNV